MTIRIRLKELEGDFMNELGAAREALATGVIDGEEFKRRARKAIAVFNRSILAELRPGLAR